ncbi:sigma-54-dependent Fis family transcriptional regulator [bacterium]|nr:MAG: sigma-54-dependent Fis family transcriptional regulator [bacterium]
MPNSNQFKILVIEDNATMREGIVEVLKPQYTVECSSNGQDGLTLIRKQYFDVVITDYKMSALDGIKVLKNVKEISPETEVILITAFGTVDIAVEAMKLGASDFITKPFSPDELLLKLNKILKVYQERRLFVKTDEENKYLREVIRDKYNFGEIVGSSPRMKDIYELVRKSSETDSSVVIFGESGTGKELIARAIHYNSSRKDKPFIKVNCAALTETLLESELFGHEKGSFTGAIKTKKGRFELADTGTLFLDEIGDITPNVQVKLLRVIQEQEFERVGGEVTLRVNTRIIAATNRNLLDGVKKGVFREDLYYRLHVIPILLPPLRDRKEDIILLTEFFIHKIEKDTGKKIKVEQGIHEILQKYHWPGNVRELENIIERAVALADHNTLTPADFSMIQNAEREFLLNLEDVESAGLDAMLEQIEKSMIEKALDKSGGTRTEAARILGIKTSAFYYKLEKYGLL